MKATTRVQDTDIGYLCQRLDRLEKENRRLKRFILGVCVIGIALLAMGQTRPVPKSVPRVIEAEKFVLKDVSGKEKAWLQMKDTGPELKLDEVTAKRAAFTSIGAATMHMYSTGEGRDQADCSSPFLRKTKNKR